MFKPKKNPNLLNHILVYDCFPVWHVGTDYLSEIAKNWYDYLVSKGVELYWETKVTILILKLER
jgi:uncharacterized FAD-dependent dehydrogenase